MGKILPIHQPHASTTTGRRVDASQGVPAVREVPEQRNEAHTAIQLFPRRPPDSRSENWSLHFDHRHPRLLHPILPFGGFRQAVFFREKTSRRSHSAGNFHRKRCSRLAHRLLMLNHCQFCSLSSPNTDASLHRFFCMAAFTVPRRTRTREGLLRSHFQMIR